MALWCNGVDLTAGSELVVHSWDEHGLQFTGAKSEKNNYVRTNKPDLQVVHWSGGEGGYRAIFNVLKARKLGIHGFIDYNGVAYQYADLWRIQCAHAGRVNPRAIGWEMQNLGFGKPRTNAPRGVMVMEGHGRKYDGLMMTSHQIETLIDIVRLTCHSLDIPFKLPPNENDDGPLLDYLTLRQQRNFKGVIGHIHVSPKVCPGQQTLDALWDEQDEEEEP